MGNESMFYQTLNDSSEIVLAVDLNGKVIIWNTGAEEFFGYNKIDVIGNFLPITHQSSEELKLILEKTKNNQSLTFKSQKKNKFNQYTELLVSTTPIYTDNVISGFLAVIKELSLVKSATYLTSIPNAVRESKRTFLQLREKILINLLNGRKTINQISTETGINWKTADNHVIYLAGRGFAREVFSSPYVKIFEITDRGLEQLSNKNALTRTGRKGAGAK